MRSFYHVRELDVLRLLQLQQPMDVFLSHDWPQHIARAGDTSHLVRRKSFLEVCVFAHAAFYHDQAYSCVHLDGYVRVNPMASYGRLRS